MTYLVDSDRVADYHKGRLDAIDLFARREPDGRAISLITYGEIYEGIATGRDRQRHEQSFFAFLRFVSVLPKNRAIMRRFAEVRGDLRRAGQLIGDFDLLIAATALHHRHTLVTRNRAHFQRIPHLELYPAG